MAAKNKNPAVKKSDPLYNQSVVRAGRSLWSATAPPIADFAPLLTTVRAQIAVVGAGYTGLSAALHLSEAGRDVVVLEALDVGDGASGRNGGQVIPGLKFDPDTLEGMYGAGLGARLVATVAAGPDLVFELIRKHGIACDAVRSGWLQLATSESALAPIRTRVRQWKARGAAIESLGPEDAARLTGASRDMQVDGVVNAFLGGQASPDTRDVLLKGENPMVARLGSANGDVTPAANAPMEPDMMAMQDAAPAANGGPRRLAARGGLGQPVQLTGLAQMVGLAIGAPEFQRR